MLTFDIVTQRVSSQTWENICVLKTSICCKNKNKNPATGMARVIWVLTQFNSFPPAEWGLRLCSLRSYRWPHRLPHACGIPWQSRLPWHRGLLACLQLSLQDGSAGGAL